MAIVRNIKKQDLQRESKHTEVECTYSIVRMTEGVFLQIDTYGSSSRQERGKKSQSVRFAPEAVAQLKKILATY